MTPRPHPPGRGVTYAASDGHDQWPELAPLPGDFCWALAEVVAPAMVCERQLRREYGSFPEEGS